MIQTKTMHKRSRARLSTGSVQIRYLEKETVLKENNTSWERDLARLQKKLRKCAGQRSLTDELIKDRRNEAS
jgi:hypothetical protein